MKHQWIIPAAAVALSLALGAVPASAETLGFRISYGSPTLEGGDANAWIRATNALWTDWAARSGGRIDGRFPELGFDPAYEGELSVGIFKGLSFRIGGGRLQSRSQGSMFLQGPGGDQNETYAISNRMSAVYAKLGLVYSVPLIGGLSAHVGGGRHLSFIKYASSENYEARFEFLGRQYVYWFEKTGTFRSEGLGYYAVIGLEYTFFRHIGLIAELENVWSRVDGFKGPFTFRRLGPGDETEYQESGGASLYFYENRPPGLDEFYAVLTGEKNRPAGGAARNVRQGVFDFSGPTARLGLRLKF